eukprot:PhF_6_TR40567/c0_g1_i1/m.60825
MLWIVYFLFIVGEAQEVSWICTSRDTFAVCPSMSLREVGVGYGVCFPSTASNSETICKASKCASGGYNAIGCSLNRPRLQLPTTLPNARCGIEGARVVCPDSVLYSVCFGQGGCGCSSATDVVSIRCASLFPRLVVKTTSCRWQGSESGAFSQCSSPQEVLTGVCYSPLNRWCDGFPAALYCCMTYGHFDGTRSESVSAAGEYPSVTLTKVTGTRLRRMTGTLTNTKSQRELTPEPSRSYSSTVVSRTPTYLRRDPTESKSFDIADTDVPTNPNRPTRTRSMTNFTRWSFSRHSRDRTQSWVGTNTGDKFMSVLGRSRSATTDASVPYVSRSASWDGASFS